MGVSDSDPATLFGGVLDALGKGSPAGLSGLVQAFKTGGLGRIVDSWVSTGANLPVSGSQLAQVLGPPVIEQLARKTGMSREELTAKLVEILPAAVNKLTPDGKLPESGILAQAIRALSGKLP